MSSLTQILSLFPQGDLAAIKAAVVQAPVVSSQNGSTVVQDILSDTDCVRYVPGGTEFQAAGRKITEPAPDEVVLLATSVSLCGTDIDLIKKAQANTLPAEAMGKVVGHEAAGFVVGLGSKVKTEGKWQIGDMVCLDSHFACERSQHSHFDDCVHSGQSCDGIVGGIRGAMQPDGQRAQPRDGYWSRLLVVPVSALPVPLPVETAQHLRAPSTLESLGNIYMIIGQLKDSGLLEKPATAALLVSGLGATGYPLAAVAAHYGFQVYGINPSPGKRQFALEAGVMKEAWASMSEAQPAITAQLKAGKIDQVIVVVMAGQPAALEEALAALESEEWRAATRRACIVFGLYSDPQAVMPGLPADSKPIAQRDFVFSRQHFVTPSGTIVAGVCGRDLRAWQTLMADIAPQAPATPPGNQASPSNQAAAQSSPPALVTQLNQAIYSLPTPDPLHSIADELNQGAEHIQQLLRTQKALKLAANFVFKAQA